MNNAPIAIFDSGLGGLTVAKEIVAQFPDESTIYLGDTKRVPYGTRSVEAIRQFAKELVTFLLKKQAKVLIVACNTMSAVALSEIKAISSVPVIDVITPTAKAATGRVVAVIGTNATINSGAYQKKIDPIITVIAKACPIFVPLVEEGLAHRPEVEPIVEYYLKDIVAQNPDQLILGCTHYPILREAICKAVGTISIIDSAQPTAKALGELFLDETLARGEDPSHEFLVTDSVERAHSTVANFWPEALQYNWKQVTT